MRASLAIRQPKARYVFPRWERFVPKVGIICVLSELVELCYLLRLEEIIDATQMLPDFSASELIDLRHQTIKELDELLMQPENASDMTLVTEYTSTKKCLDEEVERWEKLSETLESMISN